MAAVGYGPHEIARVGAIVRKERMRSDPEVQMLEDVVCTVFLEHYLSDFIRKTDETKLARILAKTWNKMSAQGQDYASKLELSPIVLTLLKRGLDQAPE